MREVWLSGLMVAGLIVGCGPKTGPAANARVEPNAPTVQIPQVQEKVQETDPILATAGQTTIRESQLIQPLKEGYGFNLLMYVVQREMARDACREQGIILSPEDYARERKWTLEQMFASAKPDEDREKLLDQFLAQPKPRDQMLTRVEFDIILETNAAMRKLAEGSLKTPISDDDLKMKFDEEYGASVRVRHIMIANPQEALQVKRRLDAGEDFATVARVLSRNPDTKRDGGLLPPFTAKDKRFVENFRRVAFSLKEGEISDPVQAEGSYHIIKLEERLNPKAVKFEDVKESLREDLQNGLIIEAVKGIREFLGKQALARLKIEDPVLKQEFDARLKARDQLIRDRDKIKQEMEKQRQPAATAPSSAPATTAPVVSAPVPPAPTTVPATTKKAAPKATAPAGATSKPAPTTAPTTRP